MQPLCLTISSDSRHADIVCRTEAAIKDLQLAGKRISFYAVAKKAHVSRSTLYRCDDLRRLIEIARSSDGVQYNKPMAQNDRVAELECKLACVTQERDKLKQSVCHTSSVHYAVVKVA